MSKLLIALLALDIGVSLSKVFIFTWKSNCLKKKLFSKKNTNLIFCLKYLFYKVNNAWKIHWMQRSTGNSDLSLWD